MIAPGTDGRLTRRLRLSGILLILGLLIEAATLLRGTTPGSFFLFALVAAPLVAAGMALYLYSIAANR